MAEPGDFVSRCAASDVVRCTACTCDNAGLSTVGSGTFSSLCVAIDVVRSTMYSLATTPDSALYGLGPPSVGV